MASDNSPRRSFPWVILLIALFVLGPLAYFGWRWSRREVGQSTAAMQANLRGVGYMEQFDFAKAADAFEVAARLDPNWLPAQINLAIALLNTSQPDKLARARDLLGRALTREPNNPHAHYSLGIIDLYQNQLPDAYRHFEAVSRIAPNDAHTWFHMGLTHPQGKESAEAKECFEKALKLNPYLNAARYNLAQHPFGRDPKRTEMLLKEHEALRNAEWEELARVSYLEMGPFAEVIGKPPASVKPVIGPLPIFSEWKNFDVRLAKGTTWAKSAELDELHRAARARFGAAIVLLDFNQDGRADIFLPGAVLRAGKMGDLLLRNDGAGVFTDVTGEAGLAGGSSLGCAVADYDNDGLPDLQLSGVGAPRLFRNAGKGKFEQINVPALKELPGVFLGSASRLPWAALAMWAAFSKELTGVFLGSAWVDLDQDGDLDLILSRFAESPQDALTRLQREDAKEGGFVILLNVGESAPVVPGKDAPLKTAFELWKPPAGLKLNGAAVGVAVGDLDGDRDLDLLLLADADPLSGVWNDRLLRFHSAGGMGVAAHWNGALLLDINHDGRSDVVALARKKPPFVWLSRTPEEGGQLKDGFTPGTTNSPALRQGQAIDLDRDGWTDVVGLSEEGKAVLLHNDGTGKLVHRADAFGPADGLPPAVGAVAVDLDGDGPPELLMLTDEKGLQVRRNEGNGNHTLRLVLSGKRENKKTSVHTNADGIGAWVVAQAGHLWTGQERTTLQAGLGQSSLPVELGLGKHAQADVVRIRWPDGLPQAELNVATGATVKITETNRKSTSCPILFVWDGTRYRFVTDFLGGGALGEMGKEGVRPPRSEESLALDPGSMAPRDGWYRLKITEPMDELLYLDHLELLVVDHPADWLVYPDERFVLAGPPPTQELLHLSDARLPIRAVDQDGKDVLPLLRHRDERMVDDFRIRSWLGYAEEHTLELDFGPIKHQPGDRWELCLDGWTDYPYPESIWAAEQARVPLIPPTLELPAGKVKWRAWGELGFPAGLPRTMTRDVTGLIEQGKGNFRIRSSMQVYWDRIRLTRRVTQKQTETRSRISKLHVGEATLRQRGLAQEVSPRGRGPITYDGERNEVVAVSNWKGRLTRLGDVKELLQKQDDQFVLCGPGDEIEIGFDARKLPALASGQVRSFVLRTAGYTKDSSPFTSTASNVLPLPYRAMPKFPPSSPILDALKEYDRRWNTRRLR